MTDGCDISSEIALRWTKSTLVQVMAWCRQPTSYYLNQCWPRSLSPYGVTRPQWVKHLLLIQGVQPWALTKFPDFSLTFPWPFCGFPWPWDILSTFHYCLNKQFDCLFKQFDKSLTKSSHYEIISIKQIITKFDALNFHKIVHGDNLQNWILWRDKLFCDFWLFFTT